MRSFDVRSERLRPIKYIVPNKFRARWEKEGYVVVEYLRGFREVGEKNLRGVRIKVREAYTDNSASCTELYDV